MFETPGSTPAARDAATPPASHAGLRAFLDAAIRRARSQSSMLAVLCLEIDGKPFGSTASGEIDRRLRQCARRSDFVAQTEDHIWTIVAEFMDGPYAAHRLAHRILDLLEKSDEAGRACVRDSTSIGIATGSGVDLDGPRLLQRATEALRRASCGGSRRLVDAGTLA